MDYYSMHTDASPLLVGNVWDVASARIAEDLGFKSIGTSSGAIASTLGYRDGEEMSFKQLIYIVRRIVSCSSIPLSVDLEAGYSRSPGVIADHIKEMVDNGVMGVNIEDSIVGESRVITDAPLFATILSEVSNILTQSNYRVYINIRTDSFLLNLDNPVRETIYRAKLYAESGADGLFTPCIVKEEDIAQILHATELPLNVMCMPGLPSFKNLSDLGVKRISMGNFIFNHLQESMKNTLELIQQNQSFQILFN